MSANLKNISPTDLRDFAKSMGWELLPQALKDGLYVLSNPSFERRQLIFPIDASAPDYYETIDLVLHKLADLVAQPVEKLINNILEMKDDTIRFRIVDIRNENDFIPLSYAISAINGAKELFLSAACNVLKPQFNHPKLNRSEALKLIDTSRFRHTESGSFVLKVSSPVNALDYQGNLFEDTMPFARQTTLNINQSLSKIITAIEADTVVNLIDQIKTDTKPDISSNICKALTGFKEEDNKADLYLNFSWAAILPLPSYINTQKTIKIQKDYFPIIEEIRRELKGSNTTNNQESTFIASVEHLSGEIGSDGYRAGDVILNLYHEEEIIKARTLLNVNQYVEADTAHMTPGAYIKIKGKLHPGNQPRLLSDVSYFELLMP